MRQWHPCFTQGLKRHNSIWLTSEGSPFKIRLQITLGWPTPCLEKHLRGTWNCGSCRCRSCPLAISGSMPPGSQWEVEKRQSLAGLQTFTHQEWFRPHHKSIWESSTIRWRKHELVCPSAVITNHGLTLILIYNILYYIYILWCSLVGWLSHGLLGCHAVPFPCASNGCTDPLKNGLASGSKHQHSSSCSANFTSKALSIQACSAG